MIPTWIELHDYGPYKGAHKIELQPAIYAITARDEDDPDRSNWIGKSWFMSAFRYALYGDHPAESEDDMITWGAGEGGVRLGLEDGITIDRSRKRGKPTQLVLRRGGAEAIQDRAQEIIDKLVGFDGKDFAAGCWIRQKGANRIIVAQPAARTETIARWMDLGPLQRAAEVEAKRLLEAVERERQLAERAARLKELIDSVGDPTGLVASAAELEKALVADEKALAEASAAVEAAARAERLAGRERDLEHVVEDGKALRTAMQAAEAGGADLDEKARAADARCVDAEVEHRAAAAELRRVEQLVVGEGFDGRCPVTRRECPAAPQVRELARTMSAEREAARQRLSTVEVGRGASASAKAALDRLVAVRRANAGRLQAMRDQARRLMDEIEVLRAEAGEGRAADADALRAEAARLQAKIGIARGELNALRRQLEGVDAWVGEMRACEAERATLAPKIRTHREAAVVLGRNGAQREVAESNLAEIEAGANELLGGAGIDLSVRARWAREGSELATHCAACGQPFPRTAKVKQCASCGAQRGPNLIERLDLRVSSSSDGAAEDVAGLAVQLSAAAWLRRRRQAAWSAVFIDEPFASCDRAIGAMLASRLRLMLGGRYSFRQAYLISHNAQLTESMPARIEIVRRRDGSLEVSAR